MGVATIMIIACHASATITLLPNWLSHVLDLGNYGVDIFFLLSGVGAYYSLSKEPSLVSWGGQKNIMKKGFVEYIYPIF